MRPAHIQRGQASSDAIFARDTRIAEQVGDIGWDATRFVLRCSAGHTQHRQGIRPLTGMPRCSHMVGDGLHGDTMACGLPVESVQSPKDFSNLLVLIDTLNLWRLAHGDRRHWTLTDGIVRISEGKFQAIRTLGDDPVSAILDAWMMVVHRTE